MQSPHQQVNGNSAVLLVPPKPNRPKVYTNLRCIPSIRAFSSISIIAGITSIALQIAALCTNVPIYSFDPVGHGIWAGVFYIIAGSLGLASASKKTRALIITTVVFASLSIASAIVAAVLSGLSAEYGICYNYSGYINCNAWISLEWTLMGFSIGAIFNSIALTVFASIALCKGRPKSVQTMMPYPFAGPTQGHVQPVPYMNYPNQGFVPVYPMQAPQTLQKHHLLTGGFNTQPLFAVVQQAGHNPNTSPFVVQHMPGQTANQNNQPRQQ